MNDNIMVDKSCYTPSGDNTDSNLRVWKRSYSSNAILFSFLIFASASIIFLGKMVSLGWIAAAFIIIFSYFAMLSQYLNIWSIVPYRRLIKKLFFTSVLIRLFFVTALIFIFYQMTGTFFEPYAADSYGYHEIGKLIAEHFSDFDFGVTKLCPGGYSDLGFPVFVGTLYSIFSSSPFVIFVANIILSSFSVVLVYKITGKLFDDSVARTASVLMMLSPCLLYYAGLHLKETTMLFIAVAAVYYIIKNMAEKKDLKSTLLLIVLSLTAFFFRTALGVIILTTFAVYWFFYKTRRKQITNFIFGVLVLFVFIKISMPSEINIEVDAMYSQRLTQFQGKMSSRAERKGGNVLAVNVSKALLAPLALPAPYPSLVYVEGQELLRFGIGAALIKNILAFFTFLGIFYCIRHKIRETTVILVPLIGYLYILVVSGYVFSPRFQFLTTPFFLIFTAVGLHRFKKKQALWRFIYLILIAIVIIAWNFVKLKGRGVDI